MASESVWASVREQLRAAQSLNAGTARRLVSECIELLTLRRGVSGLTLRLLRMLELSDPRLRSISWTRTASSMFVNQMRGRVYVAINRLVLLLVGGV